MNNDIIAGKWKQLTGKAKAAWGELTDDELTRTEGNAERWNQIQALKTAAKIEMLGVEARQAKAAELLSQVKEALQFTGKLAQAEAKLKQSATTYRHTANQIAKIHDEIRWFAPLPLVDDKIVVQALEWTQ